MRGTALPAADKWWLVVSDWLLVIGGWASGEHPPLGYFFGVSWKVKSRKLKAES